MVYTQIKAAIKQELSHLGQENTQAVGNIKNAVKLLAQAHRTQDRQLLNYASDILDGYSHLKGFSDLLEYFGGIYL